MEFENEALKLLSEKQYTRIRRSKYSYQLVELRSPLVLLLSASLFSVFVFWFAQLSFLQSCTYYFWTWVFPLFNQTLERKCMFLLCNGILVFLVGKSGLCWATPTVATGQADDIGEKIKNDDQDLILQPFTVAGPVSVSVCEEESATLIETVTREQENELLKAEYQVQDAKEEEDEQVFAAEYEYQAGLAESGREDLAFESEDYGAIQGGGEIDTETEGPPSDTEELNKKIEEFIRKMKQELRLKAQQQQLIAA